MHFSKMVLIVSFFVSSVSFGTEEDQRLQDAQREALYFYGMIDAARTSAGRVTWDAIGWGYRSAVLDAALDATGDAAGHAAGNTAWDAALGAVGVEALNAVDNAIRGAVEAAVLGAAGDAQEFWNTACDAASRGETPTNIGYAAAEASWEYVIEHEGDIIQIIDKLGNIQMSGTRQVNWGEVMNEYLEVDLSGILPKAKSFYIKRVFKILSMLSKETQVIIIEEGLNKPNLDPEISSMLLKTLWGT